MKIFILILSLLLQAGWVTCVYASEAGQEWNEAVASAKQGENDFAYLDFHTIVEDYPQTRYAMPAEFSLGEYYFLQNNLDMAAIAFNDFYTKYPHAQESLIALAYLYKIAQIQNQASNIKEYRTKIASFRQLTFIFKENKSYNFLSGFGRRHKLLYFINKVDLYVNSGLFTEISF